MLATVLVPMTSLGGRNPPAQAGGFGEQGGDGDADADRDGSPGIRRLRNHVEVDAGAHIDDHARAAVFVEAGDLLTRSAPTSLGCRSG